MRVFPKFLILFLFLCNIPNIGAQSSVSVQTLRAAAGLCRVGEAAFSTLAYAGVGQVIVNTSVVEAGLQPRTVSTCRDEDQADFVAKYLLPTTDFLSSTVTLPYDYDTYIREKLVAIRNILSDQGLMEREFTSEEREALRESRRTGQYRDDQQMFVMVNTVYEQESIGRGPSLVEIHFYLPFDEAPRGTLIIRDSPFNDRYRNLAATLLTVSESSSMMRNLALHFRCTREGARRDGDRCPQPRR